MKRNARIAGRSAVKRPRTKDRGVLACPVCGRKFRPGRKTQRACSRPCYLALWHFEELKTAIQSGHADGLRAAIEKLGEVKT